MRLVRLLSCVYLVLHACVTLAADESGAPAVANDADGRVVLTAAKLIELVTHDGRIQWPTFQRAGSIAWFPDGRSFVYSQADPRGGVEPTLMRFDLSSGRTSVFAPGTFAVFSPDGRRVVLGSKRAIRIAALDGDGRPRPIEDIEIDPTSTYVFMAAETVSWSPDGTQLAFVAVTDARYSGYGTPDTRRASGFEIRVFDMHSHQQKTLYRSSGFKSGIGSVAWESADRLLVSLESDGTGPSDLSAQVAFLDVHTGKAVPLIQGAGFIASQLRPMLSPDRERLSYWQDFDPRPPVQVGTGIAIRALGSKQAHHVDADLYAMSPAVWTPDGASVLFRCRNGALTTSLCKVDGSTAALQDVRNFDPLENIEWFALSPDGRRLAWTSRDVFDVRRVRMLDLTSGAQQLVSERAPLDRNATALGEVLEVRWRSFDGIEIAGLLVKPVGYVRGRRYPLIVDVHGGPNGGIPLAGSLLNVSALEWQVWAAQGYAVLVTDYRESGLYGGNNRFNRRPPDQALFDGDAADIVAGARFMIDIGVADPTRLIILGHSHGSSVANWIATRTSCFAGIVTKEGRSDWRRMKEGWQPFYEWYFNAGVERLSDVMYASSPVRYASEVRAPLLYVTGQYGITADEATKFVDKINDAGGHAQLLSFGNEGHNVQSADHARTMLDRVITFVHEVLSQPSPAGGNRCDVEEVLAPRS